MTGETFQHEAMATEFVIAIAGQPHAYARQAAAAAWRELDRLENELSRFIESSDIARANRLARGATIAIGEDAVRCLAIAAEISERTGRAFDPAYASTRAPDEDQGAPLFALNPGAHTLTSLTKRLHLDLGAVGKGYALDVMAEVLRDWGVTAACLQSGGSTALALEPPPEMAGWEIGLGGHRLALTHRALSGSGIAVKGEHLIDPRSGRTAARSERAWAFAFSGAVADALSTAFFVMSEAEVAALLTADIPGQSGPCSPEQGYATDLVRDGRAGIAAVLARADGSIVGYGALPAELSKAINITPGRSPM